MTHFYQIQIQSTEKKILEIFFFKEFFIRFQCGLCRRYQSNVDEFIKHITEKHRMDVNIINHRKKKHFLINLFFLWQVVILDSANNGNIHQQIKSRGRAEVS
jgi:hypothetical protein